MWRSAALVRLAGGVNAPVGERRRLSFDLLDSFTIERFPRDQFCDLSLDPGQTLVQRRAFVRRAGLERPPVVSPVLT